MRVIRSGVLALVLMMGGLAFGEAGETHAVPVCRFLKAGTTYDTHMVYEHYIGSAGGVAGKTQSSNYKEAKADLMARIVVSKSDAAAKTQSLTVTIEHLKNGAGRDSIRPGTIVEVELSGKETVFTGKPGQPIPDNAKALLIRLFPGLYTDPTGIDQVMGTDKKRTVGEKWGINAEAVAETFAKFGSPQNPRKISGKVELKKGETDQTLQLNAEIVLEDYVVPNLAKAALMDACTKTLAGKYVLPIDASGVPLEVAYTMDMESHTATVTGRINVDMKQHTSYREVNQIVTGVAADKPAGVAAK